MLSNECNKSHSINYENTCCLKHLLMMSDWAENQMMNPKYSSMLMKTLNHCFKREKLDYDNMKLDLLKLFLEIITKYIAYFFAFDKNEYAKILVKIGLKACEENAFSQHPEIISRKLAILLNMSCIYKKDNEILKSIKFSKLALDFSVSNLDKAIIHNNLAKIYLDFNDKESAEQSIRYCYKFFQDEAEELKYQFIRSKTENYEKSKSSVISFLYYNCGLMMFKLELIHESSLIFRKGYHFSMALLGENNILTCKYKPKITESLNLEKSFKGKISKNSDIIDKGMVYKKLFPKITINSSNYSEYDKEPSFLISNLKSPKKQLKNFTHDDQEDEVAYKLQNITIKESNESENIDEMFSNLKRGLELENDNIQNQNKLKSYKKLKNLDSLRNSIKYGNKNFDKEYIKNFENSDKKKLPDIYANNLDQEKNYFTKLKNEFPLIKGSKLKLKKTNEKECLNRSVVLEDSSDASSLNNQDSFTRTKTFSKDKSQVLNNTVDLGHKSDQSSERMICNISKEEGECPGLKELILKEKQKSPKKSKLPKLKDMFGKVVVRQTKPPSAGVEKLLKISQLFSKKDPSNIRDKYFKKERKPVSIKENIFNDQMQNLEKDNIPIEVISEATPEIESLVGLETTFINKNSDFTEKLKSEMKNYSFNINNDNSDQKYFCETLYFKGEEIRESPSSNSKKPNKRATQIFRFLILNMKKTPIYLDTEKDLIENEVDNNFLESENNYYLTKKIYNSSFSEIFRSLISEYQENDKKFTTLRKVGDVIFKISLKVGSWENDKGIFLCLFKHHNKLCEIFITFDKILAFFNKVNIYRLLPLYSDYYVIDSIDSFVGRILINLCHPIQTTDKSYSIAVLTRPVGVFVNKSFEFDFFNCKCSLDFFVTEKNCVNFFLYSKSKEIMCLQFEMILDDESFTSLFTELTEDSTMLLGENEIHVPHYLFANNNHLDRKGLLTQVIYRIQEILKSSKNNDFESICEFYKTNLMKIQILNNLRDITLWNITYIGQFKWTVNYFTLMKIEISEKFYYIHKSFNLDSQDYYNILGADPKDQFELLNTRETILAHYLMLNSVKLRNINIRMLTETNYDSMIKLIKIIPSSNFQFKSTFRHNKIYFIICFEVLIYSKFSFFIKFTITESKSCMSYSKIFLPKLMKLNSSEVDEMKREVECLFNINKKSTDNQFSKERLKVLLVDFSKTILQKNSSLQLFGSAAQISQNLKKILEP